VVDGKPPGSVLQLQVKEGDMRSRHGHSIGGGQRARDTVGRAEE
jgi:hypothetical protein